jgi:hypothetical protein
MFSPTSWGREGPVLPGRAKQGLVLSFAFVLGQLLWLSLHFGELCSVSVPSRLMVAVRYAHELLERDVIDQSCSRSDFPTSRVHPGSCRRLRSFHVGVMNGRSSQCRWVAASEDPRSGARPIGDSERCGTETASRCAKSTADAASVTRSRARYLHRRPQSAGRFCSVNAQRWGYPV